MLNSTRMIYFNNLFTILTVRSISKDFYSFNEDSYDVQNFYFNNWEYFGDQFDEKGSVTVGVVIRFFS